MEARDHLFFSCSFSKRVWRTVLAECLFDNIPVFWEDVIEWGIAMLKGKNLKACLGKL
jgi:hypothetical protein